MDAATASQRIDRETMAAVRARAVFSEDERYRYTLPRWWAKGPRLCFVMLNPSRADDDTDDQTTRCCIRFARSWGYGSLVLVNLFAYIATNPDELLMIEDPIGPENDVNILRAHIGSTDTVAAWGSHPAIQARDIEVTQLLDHDLNCIALTKQGVPRHPSRLSRSLVLHPWTA